MSGLRQALDESAQEQTGILLAQQAVYPQGVMDGLHQDKHLARIQAIRDIGKVALVMGPDRTRTQLIDYLYSKAIEGTVGYSAVRAPSRLLPEPRRGRRRRQRGRRVPPACTLCPREAAARALQRRARCSGAREPSRGIPSRATLPAPWRRT